MSLFIFILISCALIGGVELVKRKFSFSTNVTRRVTHIGSALIAAIAPFFLSKGTIVSACLLFAVAIYMGRKTTFFTSIHNVERTSFGDLFLPLGEAISAMVFLPHNVAAFQFGVLVMGISDALAGLVGERYGKHKIRFFVSTKSLEGSFVFFICTLALTLFFAPVCSYQLITIPAILTVIEFLAMYGLDNVLLPTLGAFLIQFLM
jgi:phytol kinase